MAKTSDIRRIVNANIKKQMELNDISRPELIAKTGISDGTFSNRINYKDKAKPWDIVELTILAKVLKCDLVDLVS